MCEALPIEIGNAGSAIVWTSSTRALECLVCGQEGPGEVIAEITSMSQKALPAVRCAFCGSIDLVDEPLDSSPTDISVDDYVESGAGIATIAEALTLLDPSSVSQFLDVGCNYGFAMDLGRFLYGWEVLGVEPSHAGARGAVELDLDIRQEYLTATSEVGDGFDLILASEVVEHVTDPVGFLTALRMRLSASGSVVLTTPAAEIVEAGVPEPEVLGAISAGYHVFIASELGLERLLRRSGFTEVTVVRSRGSLRAVARTAPVGPVAFDQSSRPDLLNYFLERARTAAAGSSLALGMATRALRTLVARGRFDEAEFARGLVVEAFRSRHGIDLDDPAEAIEKLRGLGRVSSALAGAAFACGMMELLHRSRPEVAAVFFTLTVEAGAAWSRSAGIADLDVVDLLFQAPYHRLLALAQVDGATAVAEAPLLGSGAAYAAADHRMRTLLALCRVYTSVVAAGTYQPDSELAARVAKAAPGFARSEIPEHRVAGLDALYSLGIAQLHGGNRAEARYWLEQCRSSCKRLRPRTAHQRSLAAQCSKSLAVVGSIAAAVPAETTASTVQATTELPALSWFVDVFWCDAAGIYLQGWAHLGDHPIEELLVSIGDRTTPVERSDREDLLEFWPNAPEVVRGGFSVYVPQRPEGPVSLVARTQWGQMTQVIHLPDHQLPPLEEFPSGSDVHEELLRLIASAPEGPVLAIGVRATDELSLATQLEVLSGRKIVGLDIHPGVGVDVVGDAHCLSELFPEDHFAVVYSASLLEHVAAPWLVAAECARVLKPGGLAIHIAPWVWPTHAQPNDFWRFSPEGLRLLFSESLGFRTRLSHGISGATVMPAPSWRQSAALTMPTTSSPALSLVVAEKVSDEGQGVSWPYSEASGSELAKAYPIDGLGLLR